jgi:hypothetical protein
MVERCPARPPGGRSAPPACLTATDQDPPQIRPYGRSSDPIPFKPVALRERRQIEAAKTTRSPPLSQLNLAA